MCRLYICKGGGEDFPNGPVGMMWNSATSACTWLLPFIFYLLETQCHTVIIDLSCISNLEDGILSSYLLRLLLMTLCRRRRLKGVVNYCVASEWGVLRSNLLSFTLEKMSLSPLKPKRNLLTTLKGGKEFIFPCIDKNSLYIHLSFPLRKSQLTLLARTWSILAPPTRDLIAYGFRIKKLM